ncbi:MAG: hypothetical protein ACOC8B_02580 [Gemmatimonadota bacterium]
MAPVLIARAGKVYQAIGRFRDGSFFGNLHYFDGLKLNPQYGIELDGAIGGPDPRVTYTLQYLVASDGVSGALAERDFEATRGFSERGGIVARTAVALPRGVTLAGTLASRGMRIDAGDTDGAGAGGDFRVLRYNFSRASYEAADRAEWIHQPGLTAEIHARLAFLLEFDLWRARSADGRTLADRSLNAVLLVRVP